VTSWVQLPVGRYQVVSTWMGDCLWTGKLSQYIKRSTQPSIPPG